MYASMTYNDTQESKILGDLLLITLNFWTVCNSSYFFTKTQSRIAKMVDQSNLSCIFFFPFCFFLISVILVMIFVKIRSLGLVFFVKTCGEQLIVLEVPEFRVKFLSGDVLSYLKKTWKTFMHCAFILKLCGWSHYINIRTVSS